MQRPLIQCEKQFEQFRHALPEEWEALMREHGAFTYAGKIPSPQELLRARMVEKQRRVSRRVPVIVIQQPPETISTKDCPALAASLWFWSN